MGKRKQLFLVLTIFLLLVVLSACGSSANMEASPQDVADSTETEETAESESTEVKTEEASSETRIVETINGEVEIPANPQRVVAHENYLATLIALGIKPVGGSDRELSSPHIQDHIQGIESVGEFTGSLEKILTLKPDLIVTANNDPSIYAQLSKIAPTLVFPYLTFGNVEKEMQEMGAMLGREDEAKAWQEQFDERVAVAKQKAQDVIGDQTVTLVGAFNKDLYIYGDSLYRGGEALYQHLELQPPKAVAEEVIGSEDNYLVISYEVLENYAGDYIFVDESNGGQLEEDSPIWRNLDAVKNERVIIYEDPEYFWPYDPIAVPNQAERLAELLIELGE
ncbi:ABC transporter substrate-binding protein [Aureibacillus halotolerans]|uniref:Iron complex transport system substrate-binding protein n=1 Tax=Aureibacillus halotolerans TaxID=1508390 RepID=A0A4R6U872_9BACI|nr:ABC transporter substrate-binding protein [Aureibacillus halotolerans]TDQ41143.1 iron complex transport system substrate-binding protein [Aureibacillus halotolerans]